MLVYRIVKRHGVAPSGALTSVCGKGLACVTFKYGKRVRPRIKGSRLLAFRTEADARAFGVYGGEELWLADGGREVVPVTHVAELERSGSLISDLRVIRRFWTGFIAGVFGPREACPGNWIALAPVGTVACRSIKLLRPLAGVRQWDAGV